MGTLPPVATRLQCNVNNCAWQQSVNTTRLAEHLVKEHGLSDPGGTPPPRLSSHVLPFSDSDVESVDSHGPSQDSTENSNAPSEGHCEADSSSARSGSQSSVCSMGSRLQPRTDGSPAWAKAKYAEGQRHRDHLAKYFDRTLTSGEQKGCEDAQAYMVTMNSLSWN